MPRFSAKFRRFAYGLSIALLGALFIVLLPVILPLSVFLNWWDGKRMRTLARGFICLKCGQVIGEEAVDLGDKAWAERLAEIQKHSPPGLRYRIVRTINAVCPHCGAKYRYAKETRSFQPSDDETATTAASPG